MAVAVADGRVLEEAVEVVLRVVVALVVVLGKGYISKRVNVGTNYLELFSVGYFSQQQYSEHFRDKLLGNSVGQQWE